MLPLRNSRDNKIKETYKANAHLVLVRSGFAGKNIS